jgi:hypothetical protein
MRNNDFLEGHDLEQTPLWVAKTHFTRLFKQKGMWLAMDLGYGYGGHTYVDQVKTRCGPFCLEIRPYVLIAAQ